MEISCKRLSFKRATALVFFLMMLLTAAAGCSNKEPASIGENGFLVIQGDAVEGKVRLSLDELKAMEDGLVEADYFSVNSYGTKQYTSFKGIWVWHILREKADLKDHASKVCFTARDGYNVEYTLEDVRREDYIDEQNPATKYKMILAWEENGKENRTDEPLQLVVGQREPGDINKPYWVRNVRVISID